MVIKDLINFLASLSHLITCMCSISSSCLCFPPPLRFALHFCHDVSLLFSPRLTIIVLLPICLGFCPTTLCPPSSSKPSRSQMPDFNPFLSLLLCALLLSFSFCSTLAFSLSLKDGARECSGQAASSEKSTCAAKRLVKFSLSSVFLMWPNVAYVPEEFQD